MAVFWRATVRHVSASPSYSQVRRINSLLPYTVIETYYTTPGQYSSANSLNLSNTQGISSVAKTGIYTINWSDGWDRVPTSTHANVNKVYQLGVYNNLPIYGMGYGGADVSELILITLTNGLKLYLQCAYYFSSSDYNGAYLYGEDNHTVWFNSNQKVKHPDIYVFNGINTAYENLMALRINVNTDSINTANSIKSSAYQYWTTIQTAGSSYPNRSIAENKYNEIVSTVSAIESRDNRLMSITGGNKLTTLRNRLSTNYSAVYTISAGYYNNIKRVISGIK